MTQRTHTPFPVLPATGVPGLGRRSLLVAGAAAPLAGALGHAAPARAAGRRFGDTLGLVVKFSQGQPMDELPMVAELGLHWVRDVVLWRQFEPASGRYAGFDAAFRRRLAYYREHDVGLVALLTMDHPQHRHEAAAFGAFAGQVARHLVAEGVRFAIEIGNEPHNSSLSRAYGGQWQGKPPSPWLDQYVRMTHAALREVKAVDPAITVMTDDDMWIVHYWFVEAGLPRELDAFAVHPYTGGGPPERTAVAHDTAWTAPFQVVDADRSFDSAVRRLRDHGAARLARPPQIWITEWGWMAGNDKGAVPQDTVAAYLPRAFILAALAGVEATCWFSARDSVDGAMGLVANDGRRRPAYAAFRTLAEQLGDAVLERAVRVSASDAVRAVLFRRDGARTLVVWSEDAKARAFPLPRGIAATDHLGRPSGGTTARFDAAPVYLQGGWNDESIDAGLAALA